MKFISYNIKNFRKIEYMKYLPEKVKKEIEIVSMVLPFKTNNYVVDYLIDWENYKTDPVYILTFPNRHMLSKEHFETVKEAIDRGFPEKTVTRIVNKIRLQLNPHPAQQATNVPNLHGRELPGIQHKYRDIALFFPTQGQTCHANCTFCFRWPQFVKDLDLQFSMKEIDQLCEYIKKHQYLHEILFTGGDPMIMSPQTISKYIDKIIEAKIPHLDTIRFGTKSLTYWPFTYLPQFNDEARDMLDLFKRIVDNGFHLSIMAHFNHINEMNNKVVNEAINNIRSTGAQIRTQAPILRHINDDSDMWACMWSKQVKLGMIPYYMFIERETGPYKYFQLPIASVYELYTNAIQKAGSLSKTVTAPIMSATQGKVQIMGIVDNPIVKEKYFMLQFVRHRDYTQTFKPFFMHYNEKATWFDQLEPLNIRLKSA